MRKIEVLISCFNEAKTITKVIPFLELTSMKTN